MIAKNLILSRGLKGCNIIQPFQNYNVNCLDLSSLIKAKPIRNVKSKGRKLCIRAHQHKNGRSKRYSKNLIWAPAVDFVKSQYLPLSLMIALIMGYICPGPAIYLSELNLSRYCTIAVFIISGLLLKKGDTVEALSSWGSVLFGVLSILFFTPLLSLLLIMIPLQPPELAIGLAIFSLAPTTLSSGVTLTQIVGGNVAMALILTILTNFLAVFTMPFTIPFVLQGISKFNITLSPLSLLLDLIKVILIPSLIGYLIRSQIKGIDALVNSCKKLLILANSSILSIISWMQVSKAVRSDMVINIPTIILIIAIGAAIHTFYLLFNSICVNILNLGGSDKATSKGIKRAVILLASQKTLAICIIVLLQLTSIISPALGIAVIPCVFLHLTQVAIDSFLVSSWVKKDKNIILSKNKEIHNLDSAAA